MPFKTKCPKCEKILQVPYAATGKHVRCPACEHPFRIPHPTPETVAEQPTSANDPATRHPAASIEQPSPAQPKPSLRLVKCPACGRGLHAPESAVGKNVKCPACDLVWQIPATAFDTAIASRTPSPRINTAFDEMMADTIPIAATSAPTFKPVVVARPVIDRFETKRQERRSSSADDDLTVLEWIVCILLPGIACIGGLIYLIMGKPKAGKVIGVSLIMIFVYVMIQVVIFGVMASHDPRNVLPRRAQSEPCDVDVRLSDGIEHSMAVASVTTYDNRII